MPSDIRSFFGGKPAAPPPSSKEKSPKKSAAKTRGKRKVLEDSDDDEDAPPAKKSTPKKPASKKREPTPEEETTASGFFGDSKPKRSANVKTAPENPATNGTPNKKGNVKTKTKTPEKATPTRSSTRNTPRATRAKPEYNEDTLADIEDEEGTDIFAAEYKNGTTRAADDYEEDVEVAEPVPKPSRVASRGSKQASKVKKQDEDFEDVGLDDIVDDDDFVVSDDHGKSSKNKRQTAQTGKGGRKRKSEELDELSDEPAPPPKTKKTTTPKKTPAPKKPKQAPEESGEVKTILDAVPLVRPPTPPTKAGDKSSFKFGQAHANSGPAPASGSRAMPQGKPNCLAGLSFVFTGLLNCFSREECQALVKRYGGHVMSAPSSKTSYVVLGSDAGPRKLETIQKNKLKTIDEDGLCYLIEHLPENGGDSIAGEKAAEKRKAEEQKAETAALELEKEEEKAKAEQVKIASTSTAQPTLRAKEAANADTALWTTKYAPTQMAHVVGNKTLVERLQKWLREFPKNKKRRFKMAGPDGSGIYRAVMISGPPGIGKTTAAHLVAKLEGYDILETNASDTRSKKLVETGLKGVLDTTSLNGYFAGDQQKVDKGKKKLCLIMDEVDGMSAGDRGGVGALASICKKTEVPLIMICNERSLPKMRPFDHVTFELKFRRPTTDQIRGRLMTIGFREKIKLSREVMDGLIEGTGADIRQVINMLSTAKMDLEASEGASLDYDGSKRMSKAWEKHVVLKPWDIVGKILGGGMFGPANKSTLNQKAELYFNDHEMSYLMLQENYLGTNPVRAAQLRGREQELKKLDLFDKAANSISEGDLVDRMIHGPEQNWSLMPTHAIFSFVRPASFIYGSMAGGAYMGDNNRTRFPQWLGKNSNQQKLGRAIKEIQAHMRLKSSGDRHQIRQEYVPTLWTNLVRKMAAGGKEEVPQAIDLMDSYFLTKEDFDSLVELGVGPMSEDLQENKIEGQTKATFTRLYNQQSHPVPFMKASNVLAPKNLSKVKPDLEEAFDESEDGEPVDEAPEEEDNDLSKDKYVKVPKKKKAPASKAKGKGKGKKAAGDNDEDEDEEMADAPPPTKGKGKGRAKK